MTPSISPYAKVQREVDILVEALTENDPTVVLYMVARYALLQIRSLRGPERAAELGYSITDEIATLNEAR